MAQNHFFKTNLFILCLFAIQLNALAQCHDGAPDPLVEINWQNLSSTQVVEISNEQIPFQILNTSTQNVNIELSYEVTALGQLSAKVMGNNTLARGGSQNSFLNLRGLGINYGAMQRSGRLVLKAGARLRGQMLETIFSRALFFHPHPNKPNTILVYSEKTMAQNFNGGDFKNPPRPMRPNTATMFVDGGNGVGQPDRTIDQLEFSIPTIEKRDPIISSFDLTSGNVQICVNWNYFSNAHAAGEDFYKNGETMTARGVKVQVHQEGWQQPVEAFANQHTGCFSIKANKSKPLSLEVFAEAKIGKTQNVHIKATTDITSNPNDKVWEPILTHKTWHFNFPAGWGNQLFVNVPAGMHATLMANATWSAYRMNVLSNYFISHPVNLNIKCTDKLVNSNASSSSVKISLNQYRNKFVYGHEVGHWFCVNGEIDIFSTYGYQSNNQDPCQSGSTPFTHIMRSAETNDAAFYDGLAHFLSTIAWNNLNANNAWFRYYKDMSNVSHYQDYVLNENRVDMTGQTDIGGQKNWRDNVCFQHNDTKKYSVEIDWSRFFWNYMLRDMPANNSNGNIHFVNASGSKPSFRQIMDHLAYADEHKGQIQGDHGHNILYDTYNVFEVALGQAGLGQQQFQERFITLAKEFGIFKE